MHSPNNLLTMVLLPHAPADSTSFYWYQNERFGKYDIFTWNALTKQKTKQNKLQKITTYFLTQYWVEVSFGAFWPKKKYENKIQIYNLLSTIHKKLTSIFFFRLGGDPWRTHPPKNAKSAIKKIDTDVINIKSFSQYISDLNVSRISTQPFSRIRVHIIWFVRKF